MQKQYASPAGHWQWAIPVHHKQGVRSGEMIWLGGQSDLGTDGTIRNPDSLERQVDGSLENLDRVLREFGADLLDLTKLLCFYVHDHGAGEIELLDMIAARLPEGARPAITAIPLPYLAYPGQKLLIEGYAMQAADGSRLPRKYASSSDATPLPAPFASAVRCGKMIFVSAQTPMLEGSLAYPGDIIAQTRQVMRQIGAVLGDFGAGFDDVVKINRWYVGQGKAEDFEPAAIACGAHFNEPGPAATGIPVPRHSLDGHLIKIEVVAMLGEDGTRLPRRHAWPESLWDWTIKLPYHHGLKCHDMIFLGGQVSLDKQGCAVDPDQMKPQTRQAMVHIGTILGELGASYADVCKLTTMYEGPTGLDAMHENLEIRSSFMPDPGPATTQIVFPALAYPGMIIEIDAFAMVEPDQA
ncbi:Rid family hydrolase [Sinorhizobium sp. BG8]|uniref:RidA family protein n=1 Tax=Sinorhizobium sp. BG8 TaxID=2613773 RepID=UPI00193DE8C1|nr:Rid family hydrolase [Sinorhizobium sp. BG8]QRM57677.1 hypothetical protein F3Y30_24725 [Sinorhizobium sp. BG8]